MKLTSMIEFVLSREEHWRSYAHKNMTSFDKMQEYHSDECINYAKFLSQPLELEMFMPCIEGVVVFEKEIETFENTPMMEAYQQAKERVLFEGVEIRYSEDYGVGLSIESIENLNYHSNGRFVVGMSIVLESVEDLIKYGITLTEAAQKQIGL